MPPMLNSLNHQYSVHVSQRFQEWCLEIENVSELSVNLEL